MLPAIFDAVQTDSICPEKKQKANEIQEKKFSDIERERFPEDVNATHSYFKVEDIEVSSMGEINDVPFF